MKSFISLPLLKENLKRFWGFGAVVFLTYFLSTNFIMLVDYKQLSFNAVESILGINFPAYIIFDVFVPIISAVVLFSYLAKVNSTTAMHTMPFSRKSLYITNYISGLLLCIIPLVLNFVIMLAIKKPVFDPFNPGFNIFTTAKIFKVLVSNAVVMIFVYSISVVAGMISSNSVIHLLTALAMNFICPVMYLTLYGWGYYFLYGFTESSSLYSVLFKMHPILINIDNIGSTIDFVPAVIYLLIALALTVLGYVFYTKRKLERTGDSYVFGFIKYIIAFIFTFVPATLLTLVLGEQINFILCIIIGGLVGFIIGWMIINKSFKIFNLESLKVLAICFALIALIILGFMFDVLGYEKKLPDLNKIESVHYSCGYIGFNGEDNSLYEEENISNIRDFHKEVIEAKDQSLNIETESHTYFNIRYILKDGTTLIRHYNFIPSSVVRESGSLEKIFESTEQGNLASEIERFIGKDTNINISSPINYNISEVYSKEFSYLAGDDNKELKDKLIKALAKDLKERTFEEAISHKIGYGNIYLSMEIPNSEANKYDWRYVNENLSYDALGNECLFIDIDILFNDNYSNLVKVLKEYGLYEKLLPSKEEGAIILIKDYNENEELSLQRGYFNSVPETKKGMVVITDSTEQRQIIQNSAISYYNDISRDNFIRGIVFSYVYDIEDFDNGERKVTKNKDLEEVFVMDLDYELLPDSVKKLVDLNL